MFRRRGGDLEVFLAHPGGPFFRNKDLGAWSIPKGEIDPGEDLFRAAIREFEEEIGEAPAGNFLSLGEVVQKGGKVVHAWAFEGDREEGRPIRSNAFTIELPPGSGRLRSFPEVDRAGFFPLAEARRKIHPAQEAFLDRLAELLGRGA